MLKLANINKNNINKYINYTINDKMTEKEKLVVKAILTSLCFDANISSVKLNPGWTKAIFDFKKIREILKHTSTLKNLPNARTIRKCKNKFIDSTFRLNNGLSCWGDNAPYFEVKHYRYEFKSLSY